MNHMNQLGLGSGQAHDQQVVFSLAFLPGPRRLARLCRRPMADPETGGAPSDRPALRDKTFAHHDGESVYIESTVHV